VKVFVGSLVTILVMTACSSTGISSRQPTNTTTPSPAATRTTGGAPIETSVKCGSRPVAGHPLLLSRSDATQAGLAVLDVLNPLKPIPVCQLTPASGGRFISETKIAFW
jgi:hypothetical protein